MRDSAHRLEHPRVCPCHGSPLAARARGVLHWPRPRVCTALPSRRRAALKPKWLREPAYAQALPCNAALKKRTNGGGKKQLMSEPRQTKTYERATQKNGHGKSQRVFLPFSGDAIRAWLNLSARTLCTSMDPEDREPGAEIRGVFKCFWRPDSWLNYRLAPEIRLKIISWRPDSWGSNLCFRGLATRPRFSPYRLPEVKLKFMFFDVLATRFVGPLAPEITLFSVSWRRDSWLNLSARLNIVLGGKLTQTFVPFFYAPTHQMSAAARLVHRSRWQASAWTQ